MSSSCGPGEMCLPARSFLALQSDIAISSKTIAPARTEPFGMIFGFDSDGPNIFHFAEKVLSYFAIQMFNESIPLAELSRDLPSIYLYRPKPEPSSWIDHFSRALFNGLNIYWKEDIDRFTMQNPVCFANLVIPGTVINLFIGPRDAIQFRDRIYSQLKLQQVLQTRPGLVVIDSRHHRTWTNVDAIVSLVKHLGVDCIKIDLGSMSFQEQVQVMGNTKILCAPHGAGLTNIIFMQTGGAVIEGFSSQLWLYPLYQKIAARSGLFHFSVFGSQSNFEFKGTHDCFTSDRCIESGKRSFEVNISEFERTFKVAASMTGISIRS
jgi:hypothetical protein